MSKSKKAKLFQNGRSQAVRLPKQFRFTGTEVRIRRSGKNVILSPVENEWDEEFWACFGKLSDDFVRGDQLDQTREELFS
jgi:antitoxin VapB